MMNKLGSFGVLAMMMALGSAACAEQAVNDLGSSRSAASDDEDEAKPSKPKSTARSEESADDVEPATSSATTTQAQTTVSAAIDISFAASAGQKFGTVPIHRSCSDMGADFNQATLVDGTSLQLVNVSTKEVLVKVEGNDLNAVKQELANGAGKLHIDLGDGSELPKEQTEYAIVMGGDSRFGSVAKCGVNIAPQDDKDRGVKGSAGRFPTGRTIVFDRGVSGDGCGIIGFMQAYYDDAKHEVVARPTSPIIVAADNEGRAGFPKGDYYTGCDAHSSPLVLDLAGNGLSLSKARSDVFDIDGNGSRDAMSWVSSNDTPFLVRDANGNGSVDGATELFGNHTDPTSANGFEALARFDDTADGAIDSSDKVWSTLRLWFDRNHDGRTDAGELETLESRGVRSIATSYIATSDRLVSGGEFTGAIRQRGAVSMTDGRSIPILDVWFERQF